MFKVSDKVMRIGSNDGKHTVNKEYRGPFPQFGKVYVVEEVWDTAIGPQLMLVGFGPAPYYHGKKTGWMCKYFALLSDIKAKKKAKAETKSYAAIKRS